MSRFKEILVVLTVISGCVGNICAEQKKSVSPFVLVGLNRQASVCYDADDDLVVSKVARLFVEDVKRVTGKNLDISTETGGAKEMLVVGTVRKNKLIQKLAFDRKIDVSVLEGEWERYIIQTVEKPFPNVERALVIAGSDRRGAAYGLLSLSERIGVSPWYWWADVPVERRQELVLDIPYCLSQSPTVKYRGIFLNDEDWGLTPWASKTFEKERGNIGPKTYAKVCELLLRLKANYLAPAMHPVSTAFNQIPENKLVADSFAIVMGSTHCEPLLFNTASEWDKKTMGEWDYGTNRKNIYEVLSRRVAENSPFENVYTLALRGLHDAAMGVGMPMKEKVRLLGEALDDQRKILASHLDKPLDCIPQAFTPYKEVLEIYLNGLELPDDVTIIWPDDNYGYMKQLSGYAEQKRSGRSGVYYHVSYLGVPHSYLWFSTTPPALMYEELKKAYDTTADRIWLLNCGDLKGAEMQVNLFLDMAYDIHRFNSENVVSYPADWLSSMFGNEYHERFDEIFRLHYHLAFVHKPEYMGWGYHWNKFDAPCEMVTDTEFSFINYNEAENRLDAYKTIGREVEDIYHSLPQIFRPAFYQLLYYPVKGAELMNRMALGGQKNRWFARQQRTATDSVKKAVRQCYDSLQVITKGYNDLLEGKWRYMMSMRQNYDNVSAYFEMPHLESYTPDQDYKFDVQVENQDIHIGAQNFYSLPCFNVYLPKSHWIEIFNQGHKAIDWKAETSDKWIVLNRKEGHTLGQERIDVSIDWKCAPEGRSLLGYVDIKAGGRTKRILISAYNERLGIDMDGLFLEDNGCISMPAADFHRKKENKDIQMTILDGLGIEGKSLQLGNPIAPLQIFRDPEVPRVEYDFYAFSAGMVDVYTYVLPTFPLHKDRDFHLPENTNVDTKYSVCIDNGSLATPSSSSAEYTQKWFEGVLCNCVVNKSTLYVDKPGKHTLQIRCGDPGIVIQKVVLDFGGKKRSVTGPLSTRIVEGMNVF